MTKSTFLLGSLLLAATALSAQDTKGARPINQSTNQPINRTRAVVVGISDYQDPGIPDLRFADKDAEAFANFLRSPAGGSLDGDHLKVLTNQAATGAQFDAALNWLLDECKEGDQAVIYFSGHGDVETKTRSQQGFLLLWDSPPQAYVTGAYPIFFLKEVVSTLSTENKARVIVVTDACRAGKLAGNAIGGAQLSSQTLAQQFANEIKILSCQPNEYSIEGEQWGGGRGAFSYHLVEGLFGLADGNADRSVNLLEIGRYLEDRVTNEVAPQSQVPMVVGNRSERLSAVVPELLAQVQKNKSGQLPQFSLTDNRGIEDEVLASVDTSIRERYRLFKLALQEKVFLEPAGACADAYYRQLIAEPKLARLHNAMRRNYAAALQDDAQQAVNNLMKLEKTEVRLYRLERLKKYAPYPALLERAIELLGPDHYMFATLQARKHYFEGTVLQMESPLNPDSVLGQRILEKYRQSLVWQPDAALTYRGMAEVFTQVIPKPDSAIYYGQKAIQAAPNWMRAYSFVAGRLIAQKRFDEAAQVLDAAFALDSNSIYVWYARGGYFYWQGRYAEAEPCYLKTLDIDSTYALAYEDLGFLYMNLSRFDDAKKYFLKAVQTGKPSTQAYDLLACIHSNVGQYEASIPYFQACLDIEPNEVLCLAHLANVYFRTGRPDEARGLLKRALDYDSTSSQSRYNVAETLFYNGYTSEAETIIRSAIALDSTVDYGWILLNWIMRTKKRFPEAEQMVRKAIELNPKMLFYWSELAMTCLVQGKLEEARQAYIEIQRLEPRSPAGDIGLSDLAVMEGKMEEAYRHLEQAIQKGASYEHIRQRASLSRSPDFKDFLKKHFPEQVKD